jgi:hypothetical protein
MIPFVSERVQEIRFKVAYRIYPLLVNPLAIPHSVLYSYFWVPGSGQVGFFVSHHTIILSSGTNGDNWRGMKILQPLPGRGEAGMERKQKEVLSCFPPTTPPVSRLGYPRMFSHIRWLCFCLPDFLFLFFHPLPQLHIIQCQLGNLVMHVNPKSYLTKWPLTIELVLKINIIKYDTNFWF